MGKADAAAVMNGDGDVAIGFVNGEAGAHGLKVILPSFSYGLRRRGLKDV